MKALRNEFESAVSRSLYGLSAGSESVFKRGSDGDYRQLHIQSAWWAFQIASAKTPPVVSPEQKEAVARAICVSPEQKEAVARAICKACDENPDHVGDASGRDYRWQDYLSVAEAAIAAMAEN